MEVTTTFPTEYLGEVLNDLKGRRGKVVSTNQDNGDSVTVTSYIPEDGLHRYGLDFRAITAGRGRVTIQLHHLSEAP
jgi:elongation factor G